MSKTWPAANLRALERPEATGSVNIGTGVETSVNALYERLREASGLRVEARHGPARPGEQRRSCSDAPRWPSARSDWAPTVIARRRAEAHV